MEVPLSYLSQTNGPAYCRLVASLGRNTRPFPSNQWVPSYGGDRTFDGDSSIGFNPAFISDPLPICQILGLGEIQGQLSGEGDLMRIEEPFHEEWSGDLDWHRYGTFLGLPNQVFPSRRNNVIPRENSVSHRSYTGSIRDIDVPLYDYHTGSQQAEWYAYVPKFDILDDTPYRDFRATDINSDGFLSFEFRGTDDPPGLNRSPTTDMWLHSRKIVDQFRQSGEIVGKAGTGDWPFPVIPNGFYFIVRDVKDKSSKGNNTWHIDVEYEYRLLDLEGADVWSTTFLVHQDIRAGFRPIYGSKNPFDWNTIQDSVFWVDDRSTASVLESTLHYDGHDYSRFPVDEVYPPVVIDCSVPHFEPAYKIRAFAYPLQSSVGERSRFWDFRIHRFPQRDLANYHLSIGKHIAPFEGDLRSSSFQASSDALHKYTDVIKANHIENITQLKGLLGLLPDLKPLGRIVARAAKRDPSAILEAVDFLADAVLAFRFSQKPTTEDAVEILRTDVKAELENLLRSDTQTIYGQFFYTFPQWEVEELFKLPGTLKLVSRSKIRVQTDMSTLLTSYLTANSMGLMPTLSRLWAIVPFSFVVDWFTGMSGRLQSIDDQLLWMNLGVNWCLHSFKLFYYPPVEELASYGLESDPDDPFALTVYSREFSRLMPALKSARFDYQAPSHGPNPVTVGALVWQFL